MATLKRTVQDEVAAVFATKWKSRKGQVVPDAADVRLGNDAIKLDGTVLYADLVESTALVSGYKDFFAAEVYKAYLLTACRIIRSEGGEVTAFDGDRVMAVYVGDRKNSSAARSALKLNWAVKNVVNPAIKKQYPNTSYELSQVVGIDTGPLFVARTGIRGSNDLVWVGRAANHSAKLCDIRDAGFSSFLTEPVHGRLVDGAKFGGDPRRSMWEKVTWRSTGLTIYRSNWWWELS